MHLVMLVMLRGALLYVINFLIIHSVVIFIIIWYRTVNVNPKLKNHRISNKYIFYRVNKNTDVLLAF